jgi:hypothetical protein
LTRPHSVPHSETIQIAMKTDSFGWYVTERNCSDSPDRLSPWTQAQATE